MHSEFVQLTSCGNTAEADHLVWLLREHELRAFADGANTNTTLNHVGTALGGVRVFVRADDAERAVEIIESALEVSGDQADWYCGHCQETIEGDFAICWSCGRPREEVEVPVPLAESAKSAAIDPDDFASHEPDIDATYPDAANPYASPRTPSKAIASAEPVVESDHDGEAILQRAWRASIIGIAFLPILLHLYSMYLLICAASANPTFSRQGQRLFYAAFAVNIAAAASWGMLFYVITHYVEP